MHKTCFIFWLSLISGQFCGVVSAQDNDQPQITVVHPGLKSLTEDLLSLTELTDEEEREYGAETGGLHPGHFDGNGHHPPDSG